MLATSFTGLPLVVSGILKTMYDLALLFSFRHIKPPEELDNANNMKCLGDHERDEPEK
jgi:hypothetical protein